MAGRQIEEYSWLRSRFILPQWLKHYNAIGINHFKITGRTGTTAYIKKITEAYMSEKWTGNLLELWKSLESIYDNQQDDNAHYVDTRLDSNIIDTNNFLGKWIDPVGYIKSQSGLKPIYFNCANVECGKDCVYCKNFYERYLKNEL
jgi:collagenase-like PrtC family protease